MITKLVTWIRVNCASVLGIIQAIIKSFKEVLTAIFNLISLVAPASTIQSFITDIREALNAVDTFVETYKLKLLKVIYPGG